jgi:hypothetical protein
MAQHPGPPHRQLGEGHAHVKGDPRLLGQNRHRSELAEQGQERLVNVADERRPALEMMLQLQGPAGVRLVAVGEGAAAGGTGPERLLRACGQRPLRAVRRAILTDSTKAGEWAY